MPGHDHGPSIKRPRVYEALRRRGYDKSRAAAISNAQAQKADEADTVDPCSVCTLGNALKALKAAGPPPAAAGAAAAQPGPGQRGERLGPGVTRIRGNLCNVHGRYGKCPGSGGGSTKKPRDPEAAKRAATRFEQSQADRQARLERQAKRDQEHDADRKARLERQAQRDAEKRQRDLAKAQQPKKGGGGGKGKAPKPEKPAKQTPDEKRQANRDAVKAWMRDNDEGLAPAGFDALTAFADGGRLDPQAEKALRGMGLVEGDDGAPRLSASAHVAINAINAGNQRGAVDAIRRAQERANAAAARAASRTKAQEAYGGTPRGDLPDSAFAGPDRSFPIKTARDVRDAVRSLGRTKHNRDAVKRGIIRRARAIGATSSLPDAWGQKGDDASGMLAVYKDASGADRWFSVSSTAYRDRDREIVSRKALAQAVAIGDLTGDRGPLRFWHVPGVDLGDCDYQALAADGRVLIESGTFRDAAFADALRARGKGYQVSLGFLYPVSQPDPDGVIDDIVIFERSLVPPGRASNPYTAFAVKEKAMPAHRIGYKAAGPAAPLLPAEKAALLATLLGGQDTPAYKAATGAIEAADQAAQAAGAAYKGDDAAPAWAQQLLAGQAALVERVKALEVGVKAPGDMTDPSMVADTTAAGADDEALDDAGDVAADDPMHDDAAQDAQLFMELAQQLAPVVAQQVVDQLGPVLSQLLTGFDVDKKMGAHIAELKGMLGGLGQAQAQKDDQLSRLAADVAALQGDQPAAAAMPRPSADPGNVVPAQLAQAIKERQITAGGAPASTDPIAAFLSTFMTVAGQQ